MRDARQKLLAVIVLSLASFLSVIGAVITAIWWAIHEREKRSILFSLTFWLYLGIIGFFALLIQSGGGDGISYLIRFGAIALIATWAYRTYRTGEFLGVAVWSLGKNWGFELGLVGEMSMQGLAVLGEDVRQIRMALRLKGQKWNIRSLPSVVPLLLMVTLRRADAQATVLALRGYRGGGELCPKFYRGSHDIFSVLAAVIILGLAILVR